MTAPYYADGHTTVWHGDCLDVLARMPPASIDAVVTDPPYGLEFMGKAWDGADDYRQACQLWAAECLRVLKPGGHLVAFGGTRTYHRLASAIDDAGFDIRDGLIWLYGSGFPKSHDVGKAIDKAAGAEREVIGERKLTGTARKSSNVPGHGGKAVSGAAEIRDYVPTVQQITAPATDDARTWQGWGTALKPAHEPIVLARKPFPGTVAANVVEHGTGALNVDGCRVVTADALIRPSVMRTDNEVFGKGLGAGVQTEPSGRWPSNVVLSHPPECADTCAPGCPVAELDTQSGASTSTVSSRGKYHGAVYGNGKGLSGPDTVRGHADTGGASRFFPVFRYQTKAPASERPKVGGVAHPTVKPLALMRWLVRLITPPGGVVLDPFLGSGTTAEAARAEGFQCIGIERETEYLDLILLRLKGNAA